MLTNGDVYVDPGPDYFMKRNTERDTKRAIRQLEHLGYEVEISPFTACKVTGFTR